MKTCKCILRSLILLVLSGSIHAGSATDPNLLPKTIVAQKSVATVNINPKNCVPRPSGSYWFAMGLGGGTITSACPPDHPVMTEWNQTVGFGGFLVVSHGGGSANAMCCAVQNTWKPAKAVS